MEQKLIITRLTRNQKNYTVCAMYEDRHLLEVSAQTEENESILGNIYVGRVKDVVKSLNAAFIEIAPGIPCYYPLDELKAPVYVKKINSPRLVQGDELLVQVAKESIKTKPPRVTTNLNFTGKYLVLTTENKTLGFSKKLDKETRTRWKGFIESHKSPEFGLIVRTNSKNVSSELLLEELKCLEQQARKLQEKAPYQTCFSCMMKQEQDF